MSTSQNMESSKFFIFKDNEFEMKDDKQMVKLFRDAMNKSNCTLGTDMKIKAGITAMVRHIPNMNDFMDGLYPFLSCFEINSCFGKALNISTDNVSTFNVRRKSAEAEVKQARAALAGTGQSTSDRLVVAVNRLRRLHEAYCVYLVRTWFKYWVAAWSILRLVAKEEKELLPVVEGAERTIQEKANKSELHTVLDVSAISKLLETSSKNFAFACGTSMWTPEYAHHFYSTSAANSQRVRESTEADLFGDTSADQENVHFDSSLTNPSALHARTPRGRVNRRVSFGITQGGGHGIGAQDEPPPPATTSTLHDDLDQISNDDLRARYALKGFESAESLATARSQGLILNTPEDFMIGVMSQVMDNQDVEAIYRNPLALRRLMLGLKSPDHSKRCENAFQSLYQFRVARDETMSHMQARFLVLKNEVAEVMP